MRGLCWMSSPTGHLAGSWRVGTLQSGAPVALALCSPNFSAPSNKGP